MVDKLSSSSLLGLTDGLSPYYFEMITSIFRYGAILVSIPKYLIAPTVFTVQMIEHFNKGHHGHHKKDD